MCAMCNELVFLLSCAGAERTVLYTVINDTRVLVWVLDGSGELLAAERVSLELVSQGTMTQTTSLSKCVLRFQRAAAAALQPPDKSTPAYKAAAAEFEPALQALAAVLLGKVAHTLIGLSADALVRLQHCLLHDAVVI